MILNSLAQEENYLLDEPLITDEQVFEANLLTEEGLMKVISLLLDELMGTSNVIGVSSSNTNVALAQDDNGRKRPSLNDEYYTINGNKDIVILGSDKQSLYNNATREWNTSASFTLSVSNVGVLTYGNTTLNDIDALVNGTNYSEFIYNVQINGFRTDFEYRLELNNGNVILWSKLPGFSEEPMNPLAPEPSVLSLLLTSLILTSERRRS